MKVTVDRGRFVKALGLVSSVVSSRTPLNILKNVKLSAAAGRMTITASDMDIWMTQTLEADIAQEGHALAMADQFKSILAETTSDAISLEVCGSELVITAGASQFHVPTADAAEFPTAEKLETPHVYRVDSQVLAAALGCTGFATDETSTRYALGGVRIEEDGDGFAAVGTDGRRLACFFGAWERGGQWSEHHGGLPSVVVPNKTVGVLARMTSSGEECVASFTASHGRFEFGQAELMTRLVEGRFPAWRPMLEIGTHEVSLPAASAMSLVRQARLVVSPDTSSVRLRLANGMLAVSSSGTGRFSAAIPVSDIPAELEVCLSPQFVLDVLSRVTADTVLLRYTDGESGVFLSEGTAWKNIIMPMAKN